jgi:hypothetical protein
MSSPRLAEADTEGFVPWGRQRDAPAASFGDDDFPALGTLPAPGAGRGGGMGRGRGLSRRDEDEDIVPGKFLVLAKSNNVPRR